MPDERASARQPGVALAPSILAADLGRLTEELRAVERSGLADQIHVDIMDGQFVPPISFGTVICAAARKATALPLDVHLMVVQPARFYDELAALGVATVSVHIEACPHLHRDLGAIKALGMRAGVALNPGTPIGALDGVLDLVDQVLIMSVNPGWGGQPFLPASVGRIEAVLRQRPGVAVEVDGGINASTAPLVARAGATLLVAGSAAFGHRDGVGAGLAQLRAALDG